MADDTIKHLLTAFADRLSEVTTEKHAVESELRGRVDRLEEEERRLKAAMKALRR